ncbi:hypothetical protein BDW42DRAFT_189660 [Aspergillus taichungensis]|uniref:C2H2-type domain-containing protein n=1 Tax=Aspergillus taichungensis TaxID=482145 RepID=A0A2J5HD87_9EURO|nr:hypothetical protein BDW42DRAFT_189660 [Aspergillus taichungensis]
MARRHRNLDLSSDDSDSERESTEDNHYDTDLTEPEDEGLQDHDVSDAALLFADNEHPPEYYIQQLKNFDEAEYTKEDYGKGTTALLNRVEEKWSQYGSSSDQFCAFLRRDPLEQFTCLSISIMYTFLDWVLNLRRGKDGRRLPGTKCKSSLDTFWKVFRLVYERETSNKITKQMNRQMRRVIRRLAKKHKLSTKGRDKPPMDVEDLTKVVETTVSMTKKKFGHGRHRIELALFLQLAGLTTNLSLLRDPQGGPHRIIIEFTFEFTKEWLGSKDANTYILPEIIFDPSLVLSPHVFLLGLIFADRAFDRVEDEEILVSASQIPELRIRDGCNELPLRIDPALDDVPIFRMSERTLQGISISPDKPLPYTTIEPWVKKIGAITGFLQVTRPYSLRYRAGTALDSSAIIRGLNPEDDIMRAACRMSRSIDPNRPQELTTTQSSSINRDPEIFDLIRRRDALSRRMGRLLSTHYRTEQYTMYKKLNQEIAGARQRARNALLTQIQAKYDREQPMLEIRRQLSGPILAEEEKPLKCSEAISLPQKRLIESLLTLPRPTLEEEVARRTEAIDAVAAYALFEEGDTCRLPRDKRSPTKPVAAGPDHCVKGETQLTRPSSPTNDRLVSAIQSVMKDKPSEKGIERPLFCFICLGQQDLDIGKQTHKFSSHGDVTKHIKRKHLRHISTQSDIRCNVCDEFFSCKMHLQRHAFDLHLTVT